MGLRMVKLKVKKKIKGTIITHKLDKTEQLNTMELDIIRRGEIKELEPAQVITSFFGGVKLKFVIVNYIDMPSYLRSGVTFDEFAEIIIKILEVVRSCHSYGIRVSNLEIRPEYIYYNYTTKKVKMIYWPLISLTDYADEKKLFQQIAAHYQCRPEDEVYKSKYCSLFDTRKKFDIDSFEKSVRSIQKQWRDQDQGNVPVNSGIHKKINWDDIYGMTVALTNPMILHVSSNTRIDINKTPFVIGRSPDKCDYVIEDNYYVGRKHAILQQEGYQVYLIDNKSTNGVKLDGERITENTKVPLHTGNVIEIGNEEFIFFAPAGK